MAKQTKAFWAGAFVLFGVIIAISALIWLGIQNWFVKMQPYVTYFDASVQGLNLDSDVKFRGIPVGRVSDIKTAPDGYLIEVEMELEPEFTVRDSMRAKLGITGITGMKYIELNYVGPEKQNLHPRIDFKPPYRIIPSYPAGFEELEQALKDIYDKIMAIDTEGISYKAKNFLDTGTQTLQSIDSLASDPRLVLWTEKFEGTMERTEELLASVDELVNAIDAQRFNAQIDTTLMELRQGSQQFREMMASLNTQSNRLDFPAKVDTIYYRIDELVSSSVRLVQQSQYNSTQVLNKLNMTVAELNSAIDQLSSLMMSLEQYPSNFFFTAPPQKEK